MKHRLVHDQGTVYPWVVGHGASRRDYGENLLLAGCVCIHLALVGRAVARHEEDEAD